MVRPKQGVLINKAKPAGENNQKDDGRQGQNCNNNELRGKT